jgi:hypothetical protein
MLDRNAFVRELLTCMVRDARAEWDDTKPALEMRVWNISGVSDLWHPITRADVDSSAMLYMTVLMACPLAAGCNTIAYGATNLGVILTARKVVPDTRAVRAESTDALALVLDCAARADPLFGDQNFFVQVFREHDWEDLRAAGTKPFASASALGGPRPRA